jgi:hypothetical protein
MYDDILGPRDEKIIKINIKPKKKKAKVTPKGQTLNSLAGVHQAPTKEEQKPDKHPIGRVKQGKVDDEEEYCPECGCEVEECECEDIAELDNLCEDAENSEDCEDTEDPCKDDWDAGGEIEESEEISIKYTDINGNKVSMKEFFKKVEEDPCNGSKCHECNEREDCAYDIHSG